MATNTDSATADFQERINREIASGNEVRRLPLDLAKLERIVSVRTALAQILNIEPKNAYLTETAERLDSLIHEMVSSGTRYQLVYR